MDRESLRRALPGIILGRTRSLSEPSLACVLHFVLTVKGAPLQDLILDLGKIPEGLVDLAVRAGAKEIVRDLVAEGHKLWATSELYNTTVDPMVLCLPLHGGAVEHCLCCLPTL